LADATIQRVLGDGGVIASRLGDGYEARPEQLRMAEAVSRTLAAKSHLVVEAGTGVGKSFAYLVPAISRALSCGERVVVATNTIALQEQLMRKDVPLLAETLGEGGDGPGGGEHGGATKGKPRWSGELRAVLAKGRGNYLSVRRLKLASQRQERLLPDAASRRQPACDRGLGVRHARRVAFNAAVARAVGRVGQGAERLGQLHGAQVPAQRAVLLPERQAGARAGGPDRHQPRAVLRGPRDAGAERREGGGAAGTTTRFSTRRTRSRMSRRTTSGSR
jgi:hypothetical protein